MKVAVVGSGVSGARAPSIVIVTAEIVLGLAATWARTPLLRTPLRKEILTVCPPTAAQRA
jgi:hypothetical protein